MTHFWINPTRLVRNIASITGTSTAALAAGLAVDNVVEVIGSSAGGRQWFKGKIVALRPPPAWPPIHVKYTATLAGVTNALALPEPNTAYVHADMVRKPTA